MVLGFKEQFVEPINLCSKIHTIRRDEHNRWKQGNRIQFATGVRTKNYKCFKRGTCIRTQAIEIKWHLDVDINKHPLFEIFIDGKKIKDEVIEELAKNDGFFNDIAFLNWEAWYKKDFKGKIIHWTDKKY
jgi:hypothetical protein